MKFSTADICDNHADLVTVAEPVFRDFGRRTAFAGEIATLQVPRDFLLIKQVLAEPGDNRVLVVDGGGSLSHALLGDRLALMASDNQWQGIVVNGAVRDSAKLGQIDVGVKALSTCPMRPAMLGAGQQQVEVAFAGVSFVPGHYLYADADGLLTCPHPL